MSIEKYRLVLVYKSDVDDFSPIDSDKIDSDINTYLIIDENERKFKLSFHQNATLIQKRTIERRVASYLKGGFPIDTKGLRIGANFTLEKMGAEGLPEILLTHGHTFGKARLKRDEIPPYVEKESNYDVEPGSAARTPMATESTIESRPVEKENVKAESITQPIKHVDTSSPSTSVAETSTSAIGKSDNEIFALGQFIDQLIKQGKTVMSYLGDNQKYKISVIKRSEKFTFDIEANYEVRGTDLFQI